jgi:hypothetical protein
MPMWARFLLIVSVVMVSTQRGEAAEYHVTPTGSRIGNGSLEEPWDIQTAMMRRSGVGPGDTVWVHGGEYVPALPRVGVHLQGEKERPIIVRNWQGERAIVHAPLDIASTEALPTRYVWIWGLEIQTAGTKNPGNPVSIGNVNLPAAFNPGIKIINCVAHDCTDNGFGCWSSAEEEVHGCLIYNNGQDDDTNAPNPQGRGHGLFIQSSTHKEFCDNIIFRQFHHSVQIWGDRGSSFANITLEGNTFFNNSAMSIIQYRVKEFGGIHIVGPDPVVGLRLVDNCAYSPDWVEKATNNISCTRNALVQGNYFVSPGRVARVALDLGRYGENRGLVMMGNTFIGMIANFTPDQYGTGNVHIPDRPTEGKKIFVRKNRYEEGRANTTIFNWDKSDTVDVSVNEIGLKEGDAYEVRDAQNFFAKPVVSGTYDGKPVTIPMTGLTVAAPIGRSAEYKTPPHTAPEFGVFVIMKAAREEAPAPAE